MNENLQIPYNLYACGATSWIISKDKQFNLMQNCWKECATWDGKADHYNAK